LATEGDQPNLCQLIVQPDRRNSGQIDRSGMIMTIRPQEKAYEH
jgi:hypothetical protein